MDEGGARMTAPDGQGGQALGSTGDSRRNTLFKIGGAAVLGIALMYLLAAFVYLPAMRRGPSPGNVSEWFALLQNDRLAGLYYLGFADIWIVILYIPAALALRAALGRVSKPWTTIAVPLAFVGTAVHLATNTALSMLSLSSDYAAAATETQRAAILAAGQAILSVSRGTGSMTGLGLVWLASLLFSILMLWTGRLSKIAGWIGIVAYSLLVPSFLFSGYTYGASRGFGALMAMVTSLGGGLLSLAWYIMVGLWLLRLGPDET
jgi:hypothetical protein